MTQIIGIRLESGSSETSEETSASSQHKQEAGKKRKDSHLSERLLAVSLLPPVLGDPKVVVKDNFIQKQLSLHDRDSHHKFLCWLPFGSHIE